MAHGNVGPSARGCIVNDDSGQHSLRERDLQVSPGDAEKVVSAIIATADPQASPLRLALGSDAYGAMHRALSERLAELEGQKDLAASTDEQ
ncbi:hypothetical protein [Shinella fusca]|uniref:Uncharacterized protein n=1 Tax=Shinella fusca TaxID=544480 RepID=A0A7W7YRW1_9HYPH|nr:hypothetical protein [Shinella fusca]MBB5041099.1 hypothetical protein [Shinella fusca]